MLIYDLVCLLYSSLLEARHSKLQLEMSFQKADRVHPHLIMLALLSRPCSCQWQWENFAPRFEAQSLRLPFRLESRQKFPFFSLVTADESVPKGNVKLGLKAFPSFHTLSISLHMVHGLFEVRNSDSWSFTYDPQPLIRCCKAEMYWRWGNLWLGGS